MRTRIRIWRTFLSIRKRGNGIETEQELYKKYKGKASGALFSNDARLNYVNAILKDAIHESYYQICPAHEKGEKHQKDKDADYCTHYLQFCLQCINEIVNRKQRETAVEIFKELDDITDRYFALDMQDFFNSYGKDARANLDYLALKKKYGGET